MKALKFAPILGILLSLFTLTSCSENEDHEIPNDICLTDPPNPNEVCIELYQPVCGCNGITYGNSCYAQGIVVSWIEGACLN